MLTTHDRRVDALDRGAAADGASAAIDDSHHRVRSPHRWIPVLAMATGLACTAVASLSLAERAGRPSSSGVTIGGPADVQARVATYAPGQSSGWHTHTGLHAVIVVSGTLTVVDVACQRRTFNAGESYVGGQEVHLALNELASPLEMAVTYMFPTGISHTDFHIPAPAPANCDAG